MNELKGMLRTEASVAGFDDIGFARASALVEDIGRLEAWLSDNRHGEMSWMARDPVRRGTPADWAKTVIAVARSYPPLRFEPGGRKYAAYAEGGDYHGFMKAGLDHLAALLRDRGGRAKRFVDTSAILERAWAVRAGIGFIGKSTMLLSRTHGPYVFLGVLFTDLVIEPDEPGTGTCGECTRCIDACSTGALDAKGLDARRCISYLTIELKRPMTAEERSMTGEWDFGCDDCLTSCPYAKFAPNAIPARERGVTRHGK